MKNLFAYGTLMCHEIMEEVSGLRPDPVKACLRGYSRLIVRGEHYPAIKPDEKGYVEGILYMDLPVEAWERLDRFEGEIYARSRVQAITEDNLNVDADTYVIHPAYQHYLTEEIWDYEKFLHTGKPDFLSLYKGFFEL
jgi:gamma-glutamylcyclotransferase (GGCT)/AIG2-like uncharacterized protein YtfP